MNRQEVTGYKARAAKAIGVTELLIEPEDLQNLCEMALAYLDIIERPIQKEPDDHWPKHTAFQKPGEHGEGVSVIGE